MPNVTPDAVSSGNTEIDQVRHEVRTVPSDTSNYRYRLAILDAWLHLLQRQGVDCAEYALIHDRLRESAAQSNWQALFAAISDGYALLDRLQAGTAVQTTPAELGTSGAPALAIESSEVLPSEDWPLYGGNIHHTASTDQPGPTQGKLAWRFPVGLAWYARPSVENGRVYAPSPGIRTLLYCIDLTTGKRLWTTRRVWSEENWEPSRIAPSSYVTPAVACTPIVLQDTVILNEVGAQGRNFGERCLTHVDKESGRILRRVPIGQADYRMGYVAQAGTEEIIVFPTGTQRVNERPPLVVGPNRIVCIGTRDDQIKWDFYIGPVFGEPLLDGQRVFVGTADGVFFCLDVAGPWRTQRFHVTDRGRINWQFKASGAFNSAAINDETHIYVGANDGCIYCLDKVSGHLVWQTDIGETEPRSFKLFSKPALANGRLYIGSATRYLYCLDAATGQILWSFLMPDWIRAQPQVWNNRVYAVSVDGTLSCMLDKGETANILWSVRVGTHPVYADIVHAEGRLLVSSSDLILWCVNENDGHLLWHTRLMEEATIGNRTLLADEMGGGGWYQSKPTAAEGKVFIGTPSRFVFALDYRTGKELWRFELGAAVSGAPVYANNKVFVGQQGGEEYFYCLNAQTGYPIWKQAVGWVWSSATVYKGKVIFGGVDGYISCLEEETGKILWRYRTGYGCYPEPPIDSEHDLVYFGSWDQYIYALDIQSGRVIWQFHTGGRPDSGAPIAYDGLLYAPMIGTRLCCLDAATGAIIWEYMIDMGCMNGSPALWKDRLYISQSVRHGAIPVAARIRCLDARTGKIIWEHPGGGITGPAVAGGKVYFASTSDPYFYCVDAEGNGDGTTTCVWRYEMGERVYESVPAIYGGRAFILSESGYLYAFE